MDAIRDKHLTPSVEGRVALGCVRQEIVNLKRELTRAESVAFIQRDYEAIIASLKELQVWLAAEGILFEDKQPTTQGAEQKRQRRRGQPSEEATP